MVWQGPGVLKFGTGMKAKFISPKEEIPEKLFEQLKMNSKNLEQLIADGKITKGWEPKRVEQSMKKKKGKEK